MALATRCPDCKAMFRVVSDQLKLRGGLVRCGNCRHVFDAIGSLSYVDEAALSSAADATSQRRDDEISEAAPSALPRRDEAAGPGPRDPAPARTAGLDARAPTPPAIAPTPSAAPPPAGGSTPIKQAAAADPLAVPTLLAVRSSEGEAEGDTAAAAANGTATVPASQQSAADAQPAPERRSKRRPAEAREAPPTAADGEDIAFLQPRRSRRGFSIVYGGGSLLLALAMLAQLAVVFRSELLMRWPELRPQLAALCAVVGCTVGWPTRAEALAVVGTELQAVPGTEVLELTAVIRNRAGFRVALPAIEVTLTDTANRLLARKVFSPVDTLASSGEPSQRIDEGIGPGSDYVVRVIFEARGLSAAGFVVYPFYL